MAERPEVTIHIGQVYATREATILTTIVGSGVTACLFDPEARVGGMSHFMLPAAGGDGPTAGAEAGIQAMDLLIGSIQKSGGELRRFQAKLFGGAHILRGGGNGDGVPERNIGFIEEFMRAERIAVVSRDLGGYLPQRVRFQTDTGKVYVKRLGPHMLRQTRAEEREHLLTLAQERPRPGNVTLFGG